MKIEEKNSESNRECGCKSGSGPHSDGGSCCQSNNTHSETSHNHEHRHDHGSEHSCGHSCDCR